VPTSTKALRTWKNFVLKFRKKFDTEIKPQDENASLSLLVLALASMLSSETRSPSTGINTEKNSKSNQSDSDLDDTIKRSEILCVRLRRALPPSLPFLLNDYAAAYPKLFSKILKEIELIGITDEPFILGYTYQYWRDADRKNAQVEIQSADKLIDKARLIAFTQIYTPEWVVDFILANTILPLVEPQFTNATQLQQWSTSGISPLINSNDSMLSQLSLIDPAAGAGNFLVAAFDVLFEMHKNAGLSAEQATELIFSKQLHGCDIDPVALSVAALALVTHCIRNGVQNPPMLLGLALATPAKDEILGSLSDDFPDTHPLSKKHHVVVTNPPYIGRKSNSRHLKALLKSRFPENYHDLSAAFFEKSLSLLCPGGRVGLITQASVLSLPSYKMLRKLILDSYSLKTTVDAGPGVFPLQAGEKVNSAIMIVEKPIYQTTSTASGATKNDACFFKLKDVENKEEILLAQIANLKSHSPEQIVPNGVTTVIDPQLFTKFYGHAFNYDIPPAVAQLLITSAPLEKVADIRQGLATSDNEKFVKLIWQVDPAEIGSVWFPYVKGAGGQRYSSPIRHVVNWGNDGADIKAEVSKRYPYLKGNTAWVVKNEAYYFRSGLCFSFVNTRGIALRKLPANCIFDVGASAIFSDRSDFLLAYLNSSFMVALANSLNPTINNQVGDLKRFPVLIFSETTEQSLSQLALECADLKEEINALIDPTSWYSNFVSKIFVSKPNQETQHPISHPFYESNVRLDFDVALKSFGALVTRLRASLAAKESEIDEMVLHSIKNSEDWNVSDLEAVKHWISKYNARPPFSVPANLAEVLANNSLIHEILCSPAREYSSVLSEAAAEHSPTKRSTAGETQSRAQSWRINPESFQSHIDKYFLGFPPEPLRSYDLTGIVC